MSIDESLNLMHKYANNGLEPVVDFSGGRYSLVLLHLASKIFKQVTAVYVDTTISLPECDEFVKDTCDDWGIDLKILKRKDLDFWGLVKRWGFPGRRIRWCMKEFKSLPLRLYNESKGGDILHIVGTSMYESSTRRRVYSVRGKYHYNFSVNSFSLLPLMKWTEEMIYEYLDKNNLQINPCYEKYYGSGNCYYCPFITSLTYYKRLLDLQPKLFAKIVDAEKSMKNKGGAIYKGKGKVLHLSKLAKHLPDLESRKSRRPLSLKDCEARIMTQKIFSCQKRCLM